MGQHCIYNNVILWDESVFHGIICFLIFYIFNNFCKLLFLIRHLIMLMIDLFLNNRLK